MSGVKIRVIKRPGTSEVLTTLERKRQKMVDFKKVHKMASILLDQWVQRNFRREGSGLGVDTWPPFKHGGRRKSGFFDPTAKLLQDTGRLRASFRPFHDAKDAGIGSEIPYAKYHEEGGPNLPTRRMLPKTRDVQNSLRELFDRHVKGVTNAKGK